MRLTAATFFNRYIIEPCSVDLILVEKILATALSIIMAPLTLGIAHIIGYFRSKKLKHITFKEAEKSKENFVKVAARTHGVAVGALKLDRNSLPISNDDLSKIIQEKMIAPCYAKALPPKGEVTVPIRDKHVKWTSLSAKEKIKVCNEYALDHNKISDNVFNRLFIDLMFFGPGIFGDFLENDPRMAHGSDHASRAALFVPCFAYLYAKYHPEYNEVSGEELILAQLVAAGHDSARQSEGVDVYDAMSAEHTFKVLKELGVTEEKARIAFEAINHKDSKDYTKKSFVAKCLQNSDSAEYARLWTNAPFQSKGEFERSRKFLDIYNELNGLAQGDSQKELKNGLTYGDFLEELDFLRREMNLFIFSTGKRSVRQKLAEPRTNYYDQMKSMVNTTEYPLLNHMLLSTGVKQQPKIRAEEKRDRSAAQISFDEAVHLEGDQPIFLQRATEQLRHRRLRVCKKTVDGIAKTELSFELTSKARKDLEKTLSLLKSDSNIEIFDVPTEYPWKDFSDGQFYTEKNGRKVSKEIKFLHFGGDRKIIFKDSGIELLIGNCKFLHSSFHTVRLSAKEGTPAQEFHRVLSRIGLPTALIPSKQKDIENEGLNRLLTLRYPKEVYSHQKKYGEKDLTTFFYSLSKEKQENLLEEVRGMQVGELGLINPAFYKEAWNAGLRGFGFHVGAGDIEQTSHVMASIIKLGLLSEQERRERGISGLGSVPVLNDWQGSANQVFCRPLTKQMFDSQASLKKFSLGGPITILIDAKAIEKMPYTYPSDHGGLRNPDLFTPLWLPFPHPPKIWFKGIDRLVKRPPFPDCIEQLQEKCDQAPETMFDRILESKYFKRLIVQNTPDKHLLTKILNDNGIFDLNGLPLEEAIVVTDKLQDFS